MKKRHLFAGLTAISVLAACGGGGGGGNASADTPDLVDETVDLETVTEFLAANDRFLKFDTDNHFAAGNALQFVYGVNEPALVVDEEAETGVRSEIYNFAEWDELEVGRDFVFGFIDSDTNAIAYCAATTNLLKFMPSQDSTNSVGARNIESSQTSFSLAFHETERYMVLATNAIRGFVATEWNEATQTYTLCPLSRNDETGDIECVEETPFYLSLDKTQAPVLAQSLDEADPTAVSLALETLEDSFFTDASLSEFVTTDFVGQTVYDILPITQVRGWHVTNKAVSFGQNRLVYGDSTAQYQFAYDNRALVLDYVNGSRWYVFNKGYNATLDSYETCWLTSPQLAAGQSCNNQNAVPTYFSLTADKAAEIVADLESVDRLGPSALPTHEYPDSTEGLVQCSTLTEETEEPTADANDSSDSTDTSTDTTAS